MRRRWTPERWEALQEIARACGLKVVAGNVVHLKQPRWPRIREIASIHELAAENDITINPNLERAADLLFELGEGLFGTRADGPVESVSAAARGGPG